MEFRILSTHATFIANNLNVDLIVEINKIFDVIVFRQEKYWNNTHTKELNDFRPIGSLHTVINKINPIKNLSKKVLTKEENEVLLNELEFVYPTTHFDDETYISYIETLFVNLLGHCTDK
ncbi:unnamed protein product [Rotaria magnacalcarata]|uniref:Uncharacterized protein n=1 Tax=Rotaria magnacalcarata TaxID=392030 RepID=A0A815EPV8_9BILA|nr:unnamed protein product [Rotaria magnacalcarata]CAF1683527.1 unnamed protein product [Rotaria magnacalcarata]CAF2069162.1 unnamed protein product [Rotaria magnacalcarata]CAF5066153.1 unnamed protein product [Rotaria magnacalcarata]CAF5176768.1 unnamed protein product [Rotaria magnacalcarata]